MSSAVESGCSVCMEWKQMFYGMYSICAGVLKECYGIV